MNIITETKPIIKVNTAKTKETRCETWNRIETHIQSAENKNNFFISIPFLITLSIPLNLFNYRLAYSFEYTSLFSLFLLNKLVEIHTDRLTGISESFQFIPLCISHLVLIEFTSFCFHNQIAVCIFKSRNPT